VAALLSGPPARGQTPPPERQQQTPPRFESRVEVGLVTADVTVVDKDGRPLTGLTAADFSVRVDGRPRTIALLQFVAQEAVAPDAAPAAEAEAPALVSSNESAGVGRLITFVVDQSNVRVGGGRIGGDADARRGGLARDAARPGAADLVGVDVPPGGAAIGAAAFIEPVQTGRMKLLFGT